MLALNSNTPKSIEEQTVRDKCALAMLAKYVHDNVVNAEAYYMTAPNNEVITIPYALGVLDKIVADM